MILNIVILVFLGLMAFYWGQIQGLFSAFLHLLATVFAGALALALWEPLMHEFLADRMPQQGWGVALLVLFVLWLLVLRKGLDLLVPANMQFNGWVNAGAGGVCGFLAGILTAGITVIGIGFMPLGPATLGYQPLSIDAEGKVQGQAGEGLLVPVDRLTAGFYSRLSSGSLFGGAPMARHQPDLAQAPLLLRASRHYRGDSVISILPGSVNLAAWHRIQTPISPDLLPDPALAKALPDVLKGPKRQLVIIDTVWDEKAGTFDEDGTLRVPPTQVRLLAWHGEHEAATYAPLAVVQQQAGDDARWLVPFNHDKAMAEVKAKKVNLAWVFLVSAGQEPKFLMLRNHRFEITGEAQKEARELPRLLGRLWSKTAATRPGPVAPPPVLSDQAEIEATNLLPHPIIANEAVRKLLNSEQQLRATEGLLEVAPPPLGIPATVKAIVPTAADRALVRLKVDVARAGAAFGRPLDAERGRQPIYLIDSAGNDLRPGAFVWVSPDGRQRLNIPWVRITAASTLPLDQLGPKDELYLYFEVPRGRRITEVHYGPDDEHKLTVKLDVP